MFFDGAENRALSINYTPGGNQPRLFIVHIMEGTLAGTDSWFRNPAAQVSAHFGAGRKGELYQWVGTSNQAWHAMAANDYSIGCECEGDLETGERTLTGPQLGQVARAYAWAHQTYPAISLWLNTRPYTGTGLSWHGLGGADWGDHVDCPGDGIRGQLGEILARAKHLAA
jgi:N-acetylmuramoyl-L-alanine amidase CwlA